MVRDPEPPSTRRKLALVIGSGALKCAAAFGVAKVLQREGVPIDMVVGCSGGALCAAWVAAGGHDPDAAAAEFAARWVGAFDRVNHRSVLSALFPRLLRFAGQASIVDDRHINETLRAYAGDARIEDRPIRLFIVATDFIHGDRVVLSQGPLFDALRASVALPLVLPPWQVQGRRLVDGAVSDPVPVDVAIQEGGDIILAVGFENALATQFESGMDMVMQLQSLMMNHMVRAQYAFYSLSHHAEVLPIIPQIASRVGLRDVHLVPELVACGERAAELQVPYLRRLFAASAGAHGTDGAT
ncbi:patatin-like phospholipase family protein [Pseudorhodoferax sp.]|uniref:patatin-like phospholipase family protein n=1 Tax=Pseudorhodoferax sp. TaxID=1993553 RepID=UPI002DD6BA74|nr:patatin-like phospholipase family protein [Pseudorhodoferax sp.]